MVVGLLLLLFFFSSPILTHSSSLFSYQCGLTTAGWSIPPPPEDVNLKQVIAVIRYIKHYHLTVSTHHSFFAVMVTVQLGMVPAAGLVMITFGRATSFMDKCQLIQKLKKRRGMLEEYSKRVSPFNNKL